MFATRLERARARVEAVLSYPEDSAGGLMDPEVLTIRRDVSLDVVLRYLRSRGDLRDDDMLDQLYVVDGNNIVLD